VQGTSSATATEPRAEVQALVAGDTFDKRQGCPGADRAPRPRAVQQPVALPWWRRMADFYDSLKPEQQAKVREFMAQGRARG
jgi:protein CpxP